MLSATCTLLTAPSGTGKSYWCVYELIEKFLKDYDGKYITNLPLGLVPATHSSPPTYEGETFADRIGSYVDPENPDRIADRIELLSEDVLDTWRTGFSGPWEAFEGRDLTDSVIVIDECHNYAAQASHKATRLEWQKWCGELRHQGAKVLFVTQSPLKLCREIRHECGIRQALINQEERLDPYLNIKLFYWYQLRAKFVGEYNAKFVRMDLRDIDGEKTETGTLVSINRDPLYFQFYDSFNAPSSGSGKARGKSQGMPWERYNWPQLLHWFYRHNSHAFVKPAIIVIVALVLVLFGPMLFKQTLYALAPQAKGKVVPGEASDQQVVTRTKTVVPKEAVIVQDELLEELVELRAMREKNDQEVMKAAVFTSLTPETVGLACGVTYRVGDTIDFGMLSGKKIDAILYDERCVVVSGVRVYLGDWWLRHYDKKNTDRAAPGLRPESHVGAAESSEGSQEDFYLGGRPGDGVVLQTDGEGL